jgi:uncharacterized alkaline shock family protein YloU
MRFFTCAIAANVLKYNEINHRRYAPMPDNYITATGEKGAINISEDVISVVIGAAISEVDGVAGMAGSVGGELAEFFGKKSLSKGVKVAFEDGRIITDVIILVRYGCNIVSVAKKVQEEVVSAIESMTGMTAEVNVRVSGVAFDNNDK